MDFDNPKVYGDTSIFDGLLIFINKKVHHALMMRKHRKISDDVVHCFQMTPFINWPLFIMIFINRKERSKTVSGFFPSPCQTIWNWAHFTNLSSFHALIARSDSLQSRVSIYSTIHHHLLACFVVQMLTPHPIFWYVLDENIPLLFILICGYS